MKVWLYENKNNYIAGHIIGFDEYMNCVMDACEEIDSKTGARKELGRLLLKGENITLIQPEMP